MRIIIIALHRVSCWRSTLPSTLAAFLLAWASTVVPAWVAAKRKLRDKPASLLRAFMFMTSGGYKHVFGEQHQSNAYMVRLKNHETSNVESRSAKLMKLDGVKGIVQNTTSKKQHARRAEVSGIAAE